MNTQLPILTNVTMAVAAAQSTGALLLVVLEQSDDHELSNLAHTIASTATHSHHVNLPPLTLRIVADSHEHTLFAQVYGQPASVPIVYLLRSGRVLDTVPRQQSLEAILKAKIQLALGSLSTTSTPTTPASPPTNTSFSSSSSSPPTPPTKIHQSPICSTPAPDNVQSRTKAKPTPTSAAAPAVQCSSSARPAAVTATDGSIALAIRHLDGSVTRHTFPLTTTPVGSLARMLTSPPHAHPPTHGLVQTFPTRLTLYATAAEVLGTGKLGKEGEDRTETLEAVGLRGPSATLVVRPPPPMGTRNSDASVSVKDQVWSLASLLLAWIQAVLMVGVRAWLKVGGHRPAASDPGMAAPAQVQGGAVATGHGVPDPELVRKRRLQTLADLNKREEGDKENLETYNGNSTSHEQ